MSGRLGIYSQAGNRLPFAFGNALEFDGVNDYVDLGSGAAVLTTAFEWTISLWIKPTKTGVSLGGGNSSANDLLYLINSTLFRVQFAGGSAALSRLNFTIPTVTLNQWHHVCVTKDSSNDVRLYWDGTESVTGALPTNDTINMYQLGSYRRVGLWFEGVMDEFGLDITTAASSSQVGDLYNGGSGASFLKVMRSARVNYHLDEVSGSSVAVDVTTNGNDGILNNFNTSTCWVEHGFSFGNALEFDGANDYVSISNMVLGKNSSWSLSFWYKSGTASTNYIMGNTGVQRLFYCTNTSLLFNDGVVQKSFGVTNFNDLTWKHVFLTSNSGSVSAYIDGTASASNPVDFTTFTNDFTINSIGRNLAIYLNGTLDEMAYWNGVSGSLTDAQNLYNSGQGDFANNVISSPNRYYKLNGTIGDSTTTNDGSDYANGTLTNFNTSTCWATH